MQQTSSAAADQATNRIVAILQDMTSDWDIDFSGDIDTGTCLIRDLAFESIDIVQFVVALEQEFGKRNIPFDKLLMTDGRYVSDLSVGQVATFLSEHV